MSKYVFDLDGTIIDSTQRHVILLKKLLTEENLDYGNEIDEKYLEYKRLGKDGLDFLSSVLKLPDIVSASIHRRWIEEIESDDMLDLDKLYIESIPLLKKLNKEDVFFLTSRKRSDAALGEVERFRLNELSKETFVVNPSNSERKRDVLARLKGYYTDVVMIGDTENDYDEAIAAEVKVYVLNRGFRSKDYWNHRNIKSFSSLQEIFEMEDNYL
jgi:phosphoglycolate phosphatase-like HAD superfamily hydrolase